MISKGDALCLNLIRVILLLRDLLEIRCRIKYRRYGLSVFELRCSWRCLPGNVELVRYDRDGVGDKVKVFCCLTFLAAFPGDVLCVCARWLITAVSEHL